MTSRSLTWVLALIALVVATEACVKQRSAQSNSPKATAGASWDAAAVEFLACLNTAPPAGEAPPKPHIAVLGVRPRGVLTTSPDGQIAVGRTIPSNGSEEAQSIVVDVASATQLAVLDIEAGGGTTVFGDDHLAVRGANGWDLVSRKTWRVYGNCAEPVGQGYTTMVDPTLARLIGSRVTMSGVSVITEVKSVSADGAASINTATFASAGTPAAVADGVGVFLVVDADRRQSRAIAIDLESGRTISELEGLSLNIHLLRPEAAVVTTYDSQGRSTTGVWDFRTRKLSVPDTVPASWLPFLKYQVANPKWGLHENPYDPATRGERADRPVVPISMPTTLTQGIKSLQLPVKSGTLTWDILAASSELRFRKTPPTGEPLGRVRLSDGTAVDITRDPKVPGRYRATTIAGRSIWTFGDARTWRIGGVHPKGVMFLVAKSIAGARMNPAADCGADDPPCSLVVVSPRDGKRRFEVPLPSKYATRLPFLLGDTVVFAAPDQKDFANGPWEVASLDLRTGRVSAEITTKGAFMPIGDHWLWTQDAVYERGTLRKFPGGPGYGAFSPDGSSYAAQSTDKNGQIMVFDARTRKARHEFVVPGNFRDPIFLDDEHLLVFSTTGVDIYTLAGERLAQIFMFGDGEWVILLPEGYFNSSPNGATRLRVVAGDQALELDQMSRELYRPDLVAARLGGAEVQPGKGAALAKIVEHSKPPRVALMGAASAKTSERHVEFVARVEDAGGGIGAVVWRLNGVVIGATKGDRKLQYDAGKAAPATGFEVKRRLTLAPGKNVVEITAVSGNGKVESLPARVERTLHDAISEQPSLHILAIGIDKYRDGALRLKYSVPDARAVASAMARAGKNTFRTVTQIALEDGDVTRAGLGKAFATLAERAKSQDVVVVYMAGHGVAVEGRYHFLPVDFRYRGTDSILKNAIGEEDLLRWLGQVPALKSLILLDTCNAGSFLDAKVSARGMAEKAAVHRLTRATGRAMIVASSAEQVALEGYEGHGVFTYVLLEAIDRADADFGNRDGVTSTFEVAAHIDSIVPSVTMQQFGYEQYPQSRLQGREFPLGTTTRR